MLVKTSQLTEQQRRMMHPVHMLGSITKQLCCVRMLDSITNQLCSVHMLRCITKQLALILRLAAARNVVQHGCRNNA